MDRVVVFDTTLRDGEQAPGMGMNPEAKLRMARKLVELHVNVIEAGFPASSEQDAIAVQRIAAEFGGDVTIAAMCRATSGDIDMGARLLASASNRRLHVYVPCSDLHILAKLESSRDAVLEAAVAGIQRALESTDDVQFGLEDASRADRGYLCELITAAVTAGARTVTVADTVGYFTPWETEQFVVDLFARVPLLADVTLSVHCHNDLGLGVANSIAGLRAGARQVECTVNGIGERAGNASLEELVMALAIRPDYLGMATDVDTTQLVPASRLLSEILGVPVQPNKAIVGANAFAHEAGIHQHGVLVNPLTYEIMTPASVGAEASRLVFGRHSGRHALAAVLAQNGVRLEPQQLDGLMAWVKSSAQTQKSVPVEDLVVLARGLQTSPEGGRRDHPAGQATMIGLLADEHARAKPVSSGTMANDS